jgi:predicted transcriptional regulator
MSTAVADIRHNAELRLKELEPYLEEAEQLRRVIELLDGPAPAPAAQPAPRALKPAVAPVTVDARRAPQGANKRRILALVLENPGITAAEIARSSGLKRTVVASTMSRLKRTGELEPHGKGARVPADREAETLALLAA